MSPGKISMSTSFMQSEFCKRTNVTAKWVYFVENRRCLVQNTIIYNFRFYMGNLVRNNYVKNCYGPF